MTFLNQREYHFQSKDVILQVKGFLCVFAPSWQISATKARRHKDCFRRGSLGECCSLKSSFPKTLEFMVKTTRQSDRNHLVSENCSARRHEYAAAQGQPCILAPGPVRKVLHFKSSFQERLLCVFVPSWHFFATKARRHKDCFCDLRIHGKKPLPNQTEILSL